MEKGPLDSESIQIKTAREIVYERIRKAIISGEYPPGQHLVERDLAQIFKVSRTPVREALRKLELERLVTTTAFKGVIVTDYSPAEVTEFFEIRSVLEGLAARRAATRRSGEELVILEECVEKSAVAVREGLLEELIYWNDQFHKTIGKASGSAKLNEMINSIRLQINLLRMTSLISRPDQNHEEHQNILWAIRRGYPDMAEALMKHHVANSAHYQKRIDANPEGQVK